MSRRVDASECGSAPALRICTIDVITAATCFPEDSTCELANALRRAVRSCADNSSACEMKIKPPSDTEKPQSFDTNSGGNFETAAVYDDLRVAEALRRLVVSKS